MTTYVSLSVHRKVEAIARVDLPAGSRQFDEEQRVLAARHRLEGKLFKCFAATTESTPPSHDLHTGTLTRGR